MFNGYRVSVWDEEKFLEINGGDGYTKCEYILYTKLFSEKQNGKFYVRVFYHNLKKNMSLEWLGTDFLVTCPIKSFFCLS